MRALVVAAIVLGACGGAEVTETPRWWCAERLDRAGNRLGGRCERTEAACYEARDAEVYDGASLAECEPHARAFCMNHGATDFCGTEAWCHVQRDETIRAGASPTPCRATR